MKPATYITKRTITCPTCGGDTGSNADHLIDVNKAQSFGPWHCDACGVAYTGQIDLMGQVHVESFPQERIEKIKTLVVLPPQDKPVYFLMTQDGYQFRGATEVDLDLDFRINEHSCPTNWFKHIEVIMIGDDTDPHGLLRHVRSMKKEDWKQVVDAVRKEEGEMASDDDDDLDISNLEYPVMVKAFPEVLSEAVCPNASPSEPPLPRYHYRQHYSSGFHRIAVHIEYLDVNNL